MFSVFGFNREKRKERRARQAGSGQARPDLGRI
jgi:hypothetical protein